MNINEILIKKNLTDEKAYYSGIGCDDIEKLKEISEFYSDDIFNIRDKFTNEIIKVVGENDCHVVGGGAGKNEFHISFHFRISNFYEIINKLNAYFKYLEIENITSFCDFPNGKEKECDWVRFEYYEKKNV